MRGGPVAQFRGRRAFLVFYLVLGIILLVQGGLSALFFVRDGGMDWVFRLAGIGLALFLACLGLWFAGQGWQRLRDSQTAIVIGPEGLHDRALSLRPISWTDMRDLRVWDGRGGPIVVFELADGAVERAGIRPRVRMSVEINRLFGYDYRVHSFGTDADIDGMVAAVAPYATVKRPT